MKYCITWKVDYAFDCRRVDIVGFYQTVIIIHSRILADFILAIISHGKEADYPLDAAIEILLFDFGVLWTIVGSMVRDDW